MLEHRWCVAYRANHLVLLVSGFDQGDGCRVVHKIPQRAVTTRVEDGIKFVHVYIAQHLCACEGFPGVCVLLEAAGGFGQGIIRFAIGVNRWLATFWRGDGDVCACIARSEEHTSELQSRPHLVCRLLLEKKK